MKHQKRFILILDAVLALGSLCVLPLAKWMMAHMPPCVFAQWGITCPSCGATRCVRAFFSLQFGQSFLYHPVLFLIILYLGLALLLLNLGWLLNHRLSEKISLAMFSVRAITIVAIIYAAFGIIRGFALLFI